MTQRFKNKLAKGPVTFKFKKQDGTMRKMKATTNPKYFGGEEINQRYPAVYTVWDLEKKGFRNLPARGAIEVIG